MYGDLCFWSPFVGVALHGGMPEAGKSSYMEGEGGCAYALLWLAWRRHAYRVTGSQLRRPDGFWEGGRGSAQAAAFLAGWPDVEDASAAASCCAAGLAMHRGGLGAARADDDVAWRQLLPGCVERQPPSVHLDAHVDASVMHSKDTTGRPDLPGWYGRRRTRETSCSAPSLLTAWVLRWPQARAYCGT